MIVVRNNSFIDSKKKIFRAYLVTIIKALLHIDFLISFVPLQYETICETQFNCAGTADLRAFLFIRTHIVAV